MKKRSQIFNNFGIKLANMLCITLSSRLDNNLRHKFGNYFEMRLWSPVGYELRKEIREIGK